MQEEGQPSLTELRSMYDAAFQTEFTAFPADAIERWKSAILHERQQNYRRVVEARVQHELNIWIVLLRTAINGGAYKCPGLAAIAEADERARAFREKEPAPDEGIKQVEGESVDRYNLAA